MTGCEGSSSRTCPLIWSRADWVLLLAALFFSCVLTGTVIVIWNPYLETSNFQSALCMVESLYDTGVPHQCKSSSVWICSVAAGNGTSEFQSSTFAPSPMMDNESAGSTLTTTEMAARSSPDGWHCSLFPCIRVLVQYGLDVNGYLLVGKGQLYVNYYQLKVYPNCSYSACDGVTSENNVDTMLLEMNKWKSMLSSGKAFSCYVDAISSSVLLNVNYSWSLAFNSVLWVAVSGGVCVLVLLSHVIYTNVSACLRAKKKRQNGGNPNTPINLHRDRNTVSLAMIGTQFNDPSYRDITSDCNGLHPVQLSINDLTFSTIFSPPPYCESPSSIGQLCCNLPANQHPPFDPPTYQASVALVTEDPVEDITQLRQLNFY